MPLRLLVLILFTASASSIIGQTLSGSHWMKLKPEQDSILQLKEVLIRAPKNAWKKRKDTTTFNLERYRDGMEKSVEDILRKLPGIHIDAHSGSITYKGNTVQSVKLDGHDLLGQHYVAGTRNIAADLIQEVQAIEHDPEHPLLKGLESGGKTVLNLTLKKNLARLNGQINVAAGLRNDRQGVGEVQSSLLGLSGKLKSFITGGVNNRGVNNGIANDYFSESMTDDRVERKDYTIPYLLQPLFIRLPLPDQAYRFNEEKNLHLNLLMPVGTKQLVRGNFHWTNDQIQQSNFQQARLFAKNDSWQISDRMEGKHRPSLFSAAIFWEIKIRPTTMFHYKGNVEQQQSLSEWLQQMNDRQQVSSIVISQNCSQQHQLEWITRFNEHTALRSRFFCSDYQQVQSLGIIPVNPTSIDSSFLQQVLARKQVLKWQHMIQGKLGTSLYRVEAGWQWQKAAMETLLEKTFAAENVILPVAQNQLWSRQQQFYIEGSTSARAGRFLFKPLLRLSAFQWTFLIAEKHRQQKFFMPFEPELTIVQKISSSLSWIHHVEYSFRPTGVEQLYPQSVQIAPRYLQQYEGNAEPQQWWIANTTLVLNDFFRQLNAEAGLRYIAHKGIIIPQLLLNPMVMHTRFRFVPLTQSIWQFNAQAEKFIPLFKSTIKARVALNQSNYYNSVDSQLLRRNQSRHYEGELSGQTRINEQWSFSASMKLIYFTVKQGGMQVQNNRMAFHNFKCLWRPVKTMQWMVSASYYQPQWGRGAGIWLADALMRYQPKEKRWRFSFSGRNILDRRFYRETEVSDYAFIQQVTPLMPASWSAELEWRF